MRCSSGKPKRGKCPDSKPEGRTLAELVEWYRSEKAPQRKKALRHYAKQATLADAIRAAATAKTADGIMDDHQRRVGHDRCTKAAECLLRREREIGRARSFDELHRLVCEATKGVRRFGALARYDTAVRIGAKLGLRPEKVYLHCGTAKGARELGLASAEGVVERDDLPDELQSLGADDVENFLCICHGKLKPFRRNWAHERRSR
jgi:hypothetical protein